MLGPCSPILKYVKIQGEKNLSLLMGSLQKHEYGSVVST